METHPILVTQHKKRKKHEFFFSQHFVMRISRTCSLEKIRQIVKNMIRFSCLRIRQSEKSLLESGHLTESQFVAVDHHLLELLFLVGHSLSKIGQRRAVHVVFLESVGICYQNFILKNEIMYCRNSIRKRKRHS